MSITSLMPSRDASPATDTRPSLWDRLDRPDSAALHGLLSGAVWFLVAVIYGLTMSEELTNPDLFSGVAALVFSRLRPSHVNIVIFGFLSTAMFGAWYFIVPRLCRTPLRSNRLANVLLFLWNLSVIIGTVAIMAGDSKGKEYAEYPWYVNWPVFSLLVLNIVIVYRTIAARREPKLYVSLWYIGGTVVWIAMMYFVGNVMWHPFTTYVANGHLHVVWSNLATSVSLPDQNITSYQSTGSIVGLDDAVGNWFYGHNVLGLYITTGGIAVVYYLVPKITRRPLYSHIMSLIGFWSIALLYTNTGQHHLLQAPIPNWLKIISIVGSIGLFIPVLTFNTNLFMTMRGQWGQALENIPLRFLLTGAFFYLTVSFQGSVQSLMSVNRFVHFTQWVIAHAHLALLGAFGFIASGAMLYMVPQIVRKPLWSRNLADTQYWLMLLGINGFFWALTAAGLAQSSAWITLGEQVVKAYPVVKPYFYLRSVFGGMIVVGVVMQLVNLVMTVRQPDRDAGAKRREDIAGLQELGAPSSAFDDRAYS